MATCNLPKKVWMQHILEDISMIYALVCAAHFFCCRLRVVELDRILRTLIAQGSKKSFCGVLYFQRCVKVKLSLTHTHAWTRLWHYFQQWIEKNFMFCLFCLCCQLPYVHTYRGKHKNKPELINICKKNEEIYTIKTTWCKEMFCPTQ